MSEQMESEALKAAAEYLLSQSNLARKVPEDVRREIDRMLRLPASQRPSLTQVWEDLRLKERFGVNRRDFRAYARQRHLADHPNLCGPAVLGLAAMMALPVAPSRSLGRKADALAQARLAEVLSREDLSPEQLAKLLEAKGKGQAVTLKEAAQEFEQKAARRAEQAAERRAAAKGESLTLEERVRRIYGFETPKTKEGETSKE